MKTLPDNSVDAIVTDPPAGISFMGKAWDDDKGGRDNWIKWMQEIASECFRLIKPGGHALVWAIPRTTHWTATAWENAGFEPRDVIAHVFGSGFPKSLNIGKAVDKLQGNEREIVGKKGLHKFNTTRADKNHGKYGKDNRTFEEADQLTRGNSEWEGWGTALKPAREDWWLLRKPLSEKNVALNVLKWGVGGIDIDGCRVGTEDKLSQGTSNLGYHGVDEPVKTEQNNLGRFPSNLIHDGSDEVVGLFPNSKSTPFNSKKPNNPETSWKMTSQDYAPQGGFSDSGSAARFFYCPKASKSERNRGCEGMELKGGKAGEITAQGNTNPVCIDCGGSKFDRGNGRCECNPPNWKIAINKPQQNSHPTVKPIALMEYLVKLVSREGAVVLDPFMGSGSTGIACRNLKRSFIGIELDPEYLKIAEARINSAHQDNLV